MGRGVSKINPLKKKKTPKKKGSTNWLAIKRDYIAGMKPAKLVRLYKVDYGAFMSRLTRGKWTKIRREVSKKSVSKMIDTISRDDAKAIVIIKKAEREKIENLRKLVDQTMIAKTQDGKIQVDRKGNPILKDLSPKDMKDVVYAHKVLQQMTYISFGIPTVVVGERLDSDKTFADLVKGWEEENADE